MRAEIGRCQVRQCGSRRLLLAIGLSWCLAVRARAGSGETRTDQLLVRGDIPWADVATGGYIPLFLELHNRTPDRLSLSIHAECVAQGTLEVRRSLVLEGAEVRRLELPLWIVGPQSQADYGVRVDVAGHDSAWLYGLGGRSAKPDELLGMVCFTPDPVAAADLFPGSGLAATDGFAALTFAALPGAWESYTSLRAVVLDVSRGPPEPPIRSAALAYARAGGVLALFGAQPSALGNAWPELAVWLEPRFEVKRQQEVVAFACAHGFLVLSPDGPTGNHRDPVAVAARQVALISQCLAMARGYFPRKAEFAPPLAASSIVGRNLPYGWFALLLMAFAFLMGPVAFFLVKRSGRPLFLLVLVPGIAVCASAVLIVFAVLVQGLAIERCSDAVVVLDQRGHRFTAFEARALYAGMLPGKGLRPGPGTLCIPQYEARDGSWSTWNRFYRDAHLWTIDERGALLGRDFLPSRRNVSHLFVTDAASRLRLDVRREASGEIVVENQLGVALAGVWLRDEDGGYHGTPGEVAVGAKVGLKATTLREWPHEFTQRLPLQAAANGSTLADNLAEEIPRGCYVTWPRSALFLDDCGVEFVDTGTRETLVGVLELPIPEVP